MRIIPANRSLSLSLLGAGTLLPIRAVKLPPEPAQTNPNTTDFQRLFVLVELAHQAAGQFRMSSWKLPTLPPFLLCSVLSITLTALLFPSTLLWLWYQKSSNSSNWKLNQKKKALGEQEAPLCLFIQGLFAYFLKWRPKEPQADGGLCCLEGTLTFPSKREIT